MPPVSVVIPCYNGARTLPAVLDALQRQTEPPGEVIVVDSSDDGTADLVAARFPAVRVLRQAEKTLPGPGRNIGAAAAVFEQILFLDADCVPAPDLVEQARRALAEADEQVVGGAILNGTPRSVTGTALYIAEFNSQTAGRPSEPTRMTATACLTLRKDVLARVPFTDFMPGEDVVFARMLADHGVYYRFDPRMRVTHLNRRGFAAMRHMRMFGRGHFATRRRYPDLPGSVVVEHPVLGVAAPAWRYGLMLKRFAAWGEWRLLAQTVATAPLQAWMGVQWVAGFREAVRAADD